MGIHNPLDPATKGYTEVYERVPLSKVISELNTNLRGQKYNGMFIDHIDENGTVYLTADLSQPGDSGQSMIMQQVALTDIMQSRQVTISSQPPLNQNRSPITEASTNPQPEIHTSTPQNMPNFLRFGSKVDVLSSRGDAVYTDFVITDINGVTGAVTITGSIKGKVVTKQFPSMEALQHTVNFTRQIQSLPQELLVLNSANQVERGWRIITANPATGKITLRHSDGRQFEIPNIEQLSALLSRTAKAKEANVKEADELMKQLPETFDLESNGTIFEGLRIASLDKETGILSLVTPDGRLGWSGMRIRDLVAEVKRTRQLLEALREQPLRSPQMQPTPELRLEFTRNNVKRPAEQVQRATEVDMVGDLHGEERAFKDNLKALAVIDANGNWTGGNRKIVFHGDILGDRGTQGTAVLQMIAKLREQARAQGGDIILLAGNHDNWAVAFLSGRETENIDHSSLVFNALMMQEQGLGLAEFFKFLSPEMNQVSLPDLKVKLLEAFSEQKSFKNISQDILTAMRKDVQGKRLLEMMCEMKLIEQIDDALYLHTELTPEIVTMLESGNSIGETIDRVNKIYRQGLRYLLLGEGTMPNEYDTLVNTFLNTENRGYLYAVKPDKPPMYRNGALHKLNSMGINFVIHGHTDLSGRVEIRDGIKIISVDNSYGKRGNYQNHNFSTGRLTITGRLITN